MKNKWMIPLSFVAGILVTLFVPIILLALGAINMGADVKPGLIEKTLAPSGSESEDQPEEHPSPETKAGITSGTSPDEARVNPETKAPPKETS